MNTRLDANFVDKWLQVIEKMARRTARRKLNKLKTPSFCIKSTILAKSRQYSNSTPMNTPSNIKVSAEAEHQLVSERNLRAINERCREGNGQRQNADSIPVGEERVSMVEGRWFSEEQRCLELWILLRGSSLIMWKPLSWLTNENTAWYIIIYRSINEAQIGNYYNTETDMTSRDYKSRAIQRWEPKGPGWDEVSWETMLRAQCATCTHVLKANKSSATFEVQNS